MKGGRLRSIQARLILTYIVVIFFSTTVTYLFFLPRVRGYLEQRTLDQLVSQSRILGNVISGTYAFGDGNIALIAGDLHEQLRDVPNVHVRLYDTEGLLVADTRDDDTTSAVAPSLSVEGKGALLDRQVIWVEGTTDRVVHVSSPLRAPGRVIGVVDISSAVHDQESVRDVRNMMGLALLASMLASWMVAFLLSKTILGPIEQLRVAADRMAGGDLTHRVAVGQDELGRLGQAINHMAAQLEARIGEIVGQKNIMNSLLATLLDGVVALDRENRVHFTNRVAEQLLAISPEVAIGQTLAALVPEVEIAPLLAECLEQKQLVVRETPFRGRIVRFYFVPFEDEGRNHLGTMVVLHDVTDVRRLEEARAQFFGSVSHELRTPLTIIKGFASNQLDNERVASDPDLKRSLEMIDRETDRLSRLVEDILELSRLRSRKMSVDKRRVDGEALLGETLEQMDAHAARAGIALSSARSAGATPLQADPDRLKQVLLNIVDNAVKYTPVGGQVRVSSAREGAWWEVAVADTGPGIPAEELPFLFERFFRGRDTRRKGSSRGTGLGLAIVAELVDAHGGHIKVESEVGTGTTVRLRFPLDRRVAEGAEAPV